MEPKKSWADFEAGLKTGQHETLEFARDLAEFTHNYEGPTPDIFMHKHIEKFVILLLTSGQKKDFISATFLLGQYIIPRGKNGHPGDIRDPASVTWNNALRNGIQKATFILREKGDTESAKTLLALADYFHNPPYDKLFLIEELGPDNCRWALGEVAKACESNPQEELLQLYYDSCRALGRWHRVINNENNYFFQKTCFKKHDPFVNPEELRRISKSMYISKMFGQIHHFYAYEEDYEKGYPPARIIMESIKAGLQEGILKLCELDPSSVGNAIRIFRDFQNGPLVNCSMWALSRLDKSFSASDGEERLDRILDLLVEQQRRPDLSPVLGKFIGPLARAIQEKGGDDKESRIVRLISLTDGFSKDVKQSYIDMIREITKTAQSEQPRTQSPEPGGKI